MDNLYTVLFGTLSKEGLWRRVLSLSLLSLAVILIVFPYRHRFLFFSWTSSGPTPDLVSTAVGLLIMLPLYFRGVFKWESWSLYSILAFVVNLTLLSLVVKSLLGNGPLVLGMKTVAVLIVIVLSWMGLHAFAGIGWILLILGGTFSLLRMNRIMGIRGYGFILSSSLGILIQGDLNPRTAWALLRSQYTHTDKAKRDLSAAGNRVRFLKK